MYKAKHQEIWPGLFWEETAKRGRRTVPTYPIIINFIVEITERIFNNIILPWSMNTHEQVFHLQQALLERDG